MASGRFQQSRVGVLGTGQVGQRLACGFNSRGHEVMIGTRDPGKPELREWLAADGARVQAGTFAQAAEHGELLVLAVLGNAAVDVIAHAGTPNFSGKVVGQDRRRTGRLEPRLQGARRLAVNRGDP